MIVDQLPRLTGVRAAGSGFFSQLYTFALNVSHVHWPTVGLAAAVLVLLLVAPRYWRLVPRPLLALVAVTAWWRHSGWTSGTGSP